MRTELARACRGAKLDAHKMRTQLCLLLLSAPLLLGQCPEPVEEGSAAADPPRGARLEELRQIPAPSQAWGGLGSVSVTCVLGVFTLFCEVLECWQA